MLCAGLLASTLAGQLGGADASGRPKSQAAAQTTRLGAASLPRRGHLCLFFGSVSVASSSVWGSENLFLVK